MEIDAATTTFTTIGGVGLLLLVVSLIFGDLIDGLFDALPFEFGGAGLLSSTTLAAFLTAFGFGAALITGTTGAGVALASLGGIAAGAGVGGIAMVMVRALVNMPTDESMDTDDLAGARGTVVTDILAGQYGEVTVSHLGQNHKLNARALAPLPAGTPVRVTSVLSSSSVLVQSDSEPTTN